MLTKPSYRSSKRYMTISHACAWAVVFMVVIAASFGSAGALALAPTIIPTMAVLIASILGIHRVTGSRDMRTLVKLAGDRSGGVP